MVKGRRARTYSRVKLNLISDSVLGSLRSYYGVRQQERHKKIGFKEEIKRPVRPAGDARYSSQDPFIR